MSELFPNVNTTLDLNGPTLVFTENPVGLTTNHRGSVTLSGFATAIFPEGQTERSSNTGSNSATINVTAGTTYPATIVNNPNGFSLKNSKSKICFQDSLGTDCNAQITIGTVNNNNQNAIVASSLDLSSDGTGNLIWHTRLASGYEYTDV